MLKLNLTQKPERNFIEKHQQTDGRNSSDL